MSEPTHIISVDQRRLAEQVQSYLQERNISSEVRHTGEQEWQLHVHFAAQRDKAIAEVQESLKSVQSKQADYLWQHGKPVKPTASPSPINVMAHLHAFWRAPFMALVTLCSIVAYLGAFSLWFEPVREFLRFAPPQQLFVSGQWWRLIGPAFMHFSLLHIAFNLMWWWVLGGLIERRFGSTSLILLFVVTALASNYAQYLDSGSNFGGLSGVVYGVFGFVWWVGWLRPEWQVALPKQLVGFMLVWLVIGYAGVLPVNMANTAHTVGLIGGCGLASLLSLIGRRQS